MDVLTLLLIIAAVFIVAIVSILLAKSYIEKKGKNKFREVDRNAFVDAVDKFMFRKEFKVLQIVSKILPDGYIAYPKISVKSLIEPVGSKDLFTRIKNKLVDIVVVEVNTLKPVIVIDIYDNNPGDSSLEVDAPLVVKALHMAKIPLVSIKVKTDYTEEDIKAPIYKVIMPTEVKDKEKQTNL